MAKKKGAFELVILLTPTDSFPCFLHTAGAIYFFLLSCSKIFTSVAHLHNTRNKQKNPTTHAKIIFPIAIYLHHIKNLSINEMKLKP